MSGWEAVPSTDELADMEAHGEFDEYLDSVYFDVRRSPQQRRFHDREGFFAHTAGSAPCLTLGHIEPADGWDSDDEQHPEGFEGHPLCPATTYGECCTVCEGECDAPEWLLMSTRGELWALVAEAVTA